MQQAELEALRKRWQLDRSPQLALKLAEEYRRAGQPSRAVDVLREDLSVHPNHISSRVALGRYLLEAASAGEAAEVLEDVVAVDPTHLVANKLLVRAYSELGDRQRAVDRLDLYELLNESDPEIPDLRSGIEGEPAAAATAPTAPQPAPAPAGEAPQTAEELFEEAAPTAAAPGEPFAGLWDGLDRERWRAAIAAEGLFALAPPAPAPEPPAPETAPAGEAVATATLGQLYLEQGHRDEAERIFREVLEREPGNAAAREGLASLEAVAAPAEGGPLTAAQLLAGRELPDGASLTVRRKALLESYLERLKPGSG